MAHVLSRDLTEITTTRSDQVIKSNKKNFETTLMYEDNNEN